MTVYKRIDKGVEAQFYSYKFTINKIPYRGTCKGCTTQKDAEEYERKKKKEVMNQIKDLPLNEQIVNLIRSNTSLETKRILEIVEIMDKMINTIDTGLLLEDSFERYLLKPTKNPPSERQIEENRTKFNDFLKFMKSKYPELIYLSDVKKVHGEEYINYLKTHGNFDQVHVMKRTTGKTYKKEKVCEYTYTNNKLSNTTINSKHNCIKAVFSRLLEDEGLLFNPFNFPTLKKDSVSREVFSNDELVLINQNLTMPITKPVFLTGLYTGLSLKDISTLKWSEIKDGFIVRKRSKTGSSLEIPIHSELKLFFDTIEKGSGEFVFESVNKAYQSSSLTDIIRNFLTSLGIENSVDVGTVKSRSIKGAHSLRHSFAFYAGLLQTPNSTIQSLLGHMTPEMTEHYQKHTRRTDKQNLVDQFPNILKSNINDTS